MVAANKSVLIVDDEEVVRKSFGRVLSEAGYRVSSAENGPEAVARFRAEPADLVLMDLNLPGGMDGLNVVRKVQESQPDVPVIVVTGYPSPETEQEAEQLGVREYLTKPLSPSALIQAAGQAFGRVLKPAPTAVAQVISVPGQGGIVDVPAPSEWVVDDLVEQVSTRVEAVTATFKSLGLLIAAPFIGLAYVVFLPFIGFAVLAGVAGKSLWSTVRPQGE